MECNVINKLVYVALGSLILGGWMSSTAVAQDVTLTSRSGGLSVSGTLLSFDGEVYQVDTDLGRITIANSDLICEGEGCPDPSEFIDTFSIIPTSRIPLSSVLDLLEAYAKEANKKLSRQGSYEKPAAVEVSDSADTVESIVSFTSGEANMSFNAKPQGAAIGFDAVQITSTSALLRTPILTETLRDIWTGQITNWQELGGPDKKIRIILPIYADDLFAAFEKFDPAMTRETLTSNAEYFLTASAIYETVISDPLVIGMVYKTDPSLETVAIDSGCSLVSTPSAFSIQSLEYPLAFQLNLNSLTTTAPRTGRLVQDFTATDSAQRIFKHTGLIPLVGESIPASYQSKRLSDAILAAGENPNIAGLQEFTAFSQTATRLSTTLYFDLQTQALDAQSQKTLRAFVRELEKPEMQSAQLVLVGYSDSVGSRENNLKLSKERAEAVKSAMSGVTQDIAVIGFADAAPIGCNDTEFGRTKNRRVEVWVKN